jgi:hypothetical protein
MLLSRPERKSLKTLELHASALDTRIYWREKNMWRVCSHGIVVAVSPTIKIKPGNTESYKKTQDEM